MATVERKGKKATAEGTPDHFEKMLEGSCLNHGYSIKHALKDCDLMRKFLARGSKKGDPKKPNPSGDDADGEDAVYPIETGCLMIFGGT